MALPARGNDLECYPVRTERLFAILPKKGHRLAKKRTLVMKELREEPFGLLRDDHCFRETSMEICKRARLLPQVIFESGQFSSILGMVGAGLGVSIVPEMALEQRADCTFVLIADEKASRTIGIATLKGHFLSRVQKAFLQHLLANAQEA